MKTVFTILVIAAGLLAVIVAAMVLIGQRLPLDHIAEVEGRVAAPPEAVAAWVRDVEAHPQWRPGVKRIEILGRDDAWLRYREHGPHGAIPMRLRETERDRAFEGGIDDPALPFGGRWLFRLEPDGAGTRLVIREEGWIRPPLFRFMSRYLFGEDTTLRQYLAAVQARAAEVGR